MHSSSPATFNMALLFENIKSNGVDSARITAFLKSKNIRDYRICADESLNKGNSFSDISFDLAHYLFDSINFHQLFGTNNEKEIIQYKINIYNNLISHFKLDLLDEYRHAVIKNSKEYGPKISSYIKHLLERSIKLHKNTDEFGTSAEGIENFWYVVDHYIFVNKVKAELTSLKCLIANAE